MAAIVATPAASAGDPKVEREIARVRLELLKNADRYDWQSVVTNLTELDLHRLRHALSSGDAMEVGRIFAAAANALMNVDARIFALRQASLYAAEGAS